MTAATVALNSANRNAKAGCGKCCENAGRTARESPKGKSALILLPHLPQHRGSHVNNELTALRPLLAVSQRRGEVPEASSHPTPSRTQGSWMLTATTTSEKGRPWKSHLLLPSPLFPVGLPHNGQALLLREPTACSQPPSPPSPQK